MKRLLSLALCMLLVAGFFTFAEGTKEAATGGAAQAYPWKPTRPINLIVPWAAGGSTDRSARITAGILEEYLGTSIVIVNQPGASGAVGTQAALEAAKDGYTWTAGAIKDLGTYKVKGQLDTTLDDWHIYTNVIQPQVVSVGANSPYKTFEDLLNAFKQNPGRISVATAGVNSAGHTAIEMIKRYTDIQYRHVTYDGGNPAVIATVAGEAHVTTQLSSEQVDMIRAGRLRPLAVLAGEPLELQGYEGSIPPITQWIPDFVTAATYFGIFIPKGVPQEVLTTLNMIYDQHMKGNQTLVTFARENAVIPDPVYGEEAIRKTFPMVQLDAWLAYETGTAVVSPDSVGIPRL